MQSKRCEGSRLLIFTEGFMRRKLFFSHLVLSVALFFAANLFAKEEITISAAISLKNAFNEIGKIFEEENKGAKIVFNYGASGDLMRQIIAGAPADVYASASKREMDELEKMAILLPHTRKNFAHNSVVLIVPIHQEYKINSFEELSKNEIKRIAVGNPKTVPAGRYADEVMQYLKMDQTLKPKFIFTENVRQVLDYVMRGEVDAGIVYSSDALIGVKKIRIVATADKKSHKPVIYPIAIIKGTKKDVTAKAFIAFVISAKGKKVLEKYGFKTHSPD